MFEPDVHALAYTFNAATLSHRQYAAKIERERMVMAAKIAATPRHEPVNVYTTHREREGQRERDGERDK